MQRQMNSMVMVGVMLFGQVAAFAQESGRSNQSHVETTDVRPSGEFRGPMGLDASREALAEQIHALIVQTNVKKQINDKQKQDFDGSAADAIRCNITELLLCEDTAAVANALSGVSEDYRHMIGNALNMTLHDLAVTQGTLERKSHEIEDTSMVIVTGKDTSGRTLTPEEIEWKKRKLRTLLNHRNDLTAAVTACNANVLFYRDELLALVTLDKQLDGQADDLAAHVERVMDSIERERRVLMLQDVRANQEQLRVIANTFIARALPDQKLPTTVDNQLQHPGPGIKEVIENFGANEPELTPEEARLVEAELERARARHSGSNRQ